MISSAGSVSRSRPDSAVDRGDRVEWASACSSCASTPPGSSVSHGVACAHERVRELAASAPQQCGLADARGPVDRHELGAVVDGAEQRRGELGQFAVAPDATVGPMSTVTS